MKLTTNITTTYTCEYDDFMVDIVVTDSVVESWIYREEIGIKFYMIGAPIEQCSMDEFIEVVEGNLEVFKDIYNEEFVEE